LFWPKTGYVGALGARNRVSDCPSIILRDFQVSESQVPSSVLVPSLAVKTSSPSDISLGWVRSAVAVAALGAHGKPAFMGAHGKPPVTRPRIALGVPMTAAASDLVITGPRTASGSAVRPSDFSGNAQNARWGGWEVRTAEVTLVPSAQHAAPSGAGWPPLSGSSNFDVLAPDSSFLREELV
jgi:hypothetical protein